MAEDNKGQLGGLYDLGKASASPYYDPFGGGKFNYAPLGSGQNDPKTLCYIKGGTWDPETNTCTLPEKFDPKKKRRGGGGRGGAKIDLKKIIYAKKKKQLDAAFAKKWLTGDQAKALLERLKKDPLGLQIGYEIAKTATANNPAFAADRSLYAGLTKQELNKVNQELYHTDGAWAEQYGLEEGEDDFRVEDYLSEEADAARDEYLDDVIDYQNEYGDSDFDYDDYYDNVTIDEDRLHGFRGLWYRSQRWTRCEMGRIVPPRFMKKGGYVAYRQAGGPMAPPPGPPPGAVPPGPPLPPPGAPMGAPGAAPGAPAAPQVPMEPAGPPPRKSFRDRVKEAKEAIRSDSASVPVSTEVKAVVAEPMGMMDGQGDGPVDIHPDAGMLMPTEVGPDIGVDTVDSELNEGSMVMNAEATEMFGDELKAMVDGGAVYRQGGGIIGMANDATQALGQASEAIQTASGAIGGGGNTAVPVGSPGLGGRFSEGIRLNGGLTPIRGIR